MLRQTGSVAEYLERFEQLSHGILLYNSSYDDTYFVVRFLGGLKEEIRTAISLHQPKDVQSASTLAMLQEEELDHGRRKGFTHSDQHDSGKFTPQSGSVEKGRNQTTREGTGKDDKLSAPIANRKKLGLCFKCGRQVVSQPQVPTTCSTTHVGRDSRCN